MAEAATLPAPRSYAVAKALVITLGFLALVGLGITFGGRVIAQQVISGLMLGAIYLTVAVAFTLTIGVLNFLNFTIPSLFMLTGMIAWGVLSSGKLAFAGSAAWLIALVVGVAVSTVASLIVERFTFRYLQMKHGDASEHAIPLVSSLGFLIIFEHLILIYLGSESQRFPVPFKADAHLFGVVIGLPQVASLLLSLCVVGAISYILRKTKIGRALRTIAENPEIASLVGVEVNRVVPVIFLITGLLCGLAGALFTVNYGDVSPFMGDHVGTKAIAAMVIGGLGSIWGAILGGLIVGMTETLSIHFLGGDSVQMTVWGLLLAIIIISPRGLFGKEAPGKGKL